MLNQRQVEAEWQEAFSDATLFPIIGLPSNNDGALTLTHTDGSGTHYILLSVRSVIT